MWKGMEQVIQLIPFKVNQVKVGDYILLKASREICKITKIVQVTYHEVLYIDIDTEHESVSLKYDSTVFVQVEW